MHASHRRIICGLLAALNENCDREGDEIVMEMASVIKGSLRTNAGVPISVQDHETVAFVVESSGCLTSYYLSLGYARSSLTNRPRFWR